MQRIYYRAENILSAIIAIGSEIL